MGGYIKLGIRSFTGNLLFIAAMFLIIARFLSIWSGTPPPIDLVTSNSTTPALMEGDVVVWTPTKIDKNLYEKILEREITDNLKETYNIKKENVEDYKEKYFTLKEQFERLEEDYQELKAAVDRLITKA